MKLSMLMTKTGVGHAPSPVIVVLIALVALTGCETANRNRTATGAVIGTVVGGTAGAVIDRDNPWRGGVIGGAAGAAVGAGIGYVLQRQKEAFDRIEDIETRQETVVFQPAPTASEQPLPPPSDRKEALMLRLSSEVLFERGSSALLPAGAAKLRQIADVLREYPDSDVYIRGYTSSEGSDQLNYDLSVRRAEVVRNELIASGVSSARLFAQGMGESNPIASNETEAGRAMNRRVELHVVPR